MNATRNPVMIVPVLLAIFTTSSAKGDFTFGEPEKVPGLRSNEWIDCFSYDGLEMYTEAPDPTDEQGSFWLWVRTRASIAEAWGPPEDLGPLVHGAYHAFGACISSDGLALHFISTRPEGYGSSDIYLTTRATRTDRWGPAVNLGPSINSSGHDRMVWVSADNLELYFGSTRAGGYGASDIYVARRATANDPWGTPVNLGPVVNTPYGECYVCLSPDGLLLFFGEWYATTNIRPGGHGAPDIWMTRRASVGAPWQTPVNLGSPINGPTNDFAPLISPDGHTLHFQSMDREGGGNFQVPIIPIVDFDGDGQVGGKELLAMIVQLGGNDPLCDIGPYAWGDGKVNVEDLKVLAGCIGQDVNDPTLIAHWALDEAEGSVVHNSVGATEAMATGDPTWQPAGGKIDGALAFDGMDDFVLTQFKLNPAKEPFSVLAWVKGGAPGEVVVSQQGWADWLYTNPIDGSLMTGLTGTGATAAPGFSDVVITDGQWHRIGLVWDGTNRILLVDGKEMVRDAQSKLLDHSAMVVLGAGKSTSVASRWSGLIDDVRVYNRAVEP
jgi:hypothetical protein